MGGGMGMQFPHADFPALDVLACGGPPPTRPRTTRQKTIVLFVTDGDPSVCEQDFDAITLSPRRADGGGHQPLPSVYPTRRAWA